MKLTVAYDFLPKTPSAHAAVVMDHFGIGFETGRHVIADGLELPIQRGDIVCFTGPSGSGKSSLMRAAAEQLASKPGFRSPQVNIDALELGDRILIDGLGLPVDEALPLLAACGLGEAQLLLRTPHELSDGQRYRFRLAKAFAMKPIWIVADEFTAALDRTLAKAIAFNLRKLATRTGIGCLLATTHEDVLEDLQPNVHVACRLDGAIHVPAHGVQPVGFGGVKKKDISFANELWISRGSRCDWSYFARWHYRSHNLGVVRHVTVLWHGREPIGICVFTSPALALAQRSRYFGLSGRWSKVRVQALNRQLVTLSRVVLHPTYRGAGIAAAFIRASCRSCPWPWIESLAEMGRLNPFFERAGFRRVGVNVSRSLGSDRDTGKRSRAKHSAIYGGRRHGETRRRLVTVETHEKSRYAEPAYFIFDNRG